MPELSQARILLLEDEPNVGQTLVEYLEGRAGTVVWARTVSDANQALSSQSFDLLLVDVTLPDGNGFDWIRSLREARKTVPSIFLTAHGNPEDRVYGLELGAEDYLTKPFHLKELVIRIENILRRTQLSKAPAPYSAPDGSVKIGEAQIFFSRFEALKEEKWVALSPKEVALLRLLYERAGNVVSRDEILNHVWSRDEFPTSRTVDNFIVRLRRIIGDTADEPKWIRSIRGVGYQLL